MKKPPMSTYQPDTVTRSEVHERFEYHPLKKGQAARLMHIAENLGEIAQIILDETPASREQSIAITKLEEAAYWADQAITRNE